ncbi:hypothetical protein CHS0354_038754 [Potamilus streckersoni]|uniref:Uncharacterized protein n=1 Tax=Potamilus streckersoni TaxID=2493646 RepID=A0AAE0SS92_9BIVA|nr:hypothetical protein CHS0354_038754 [Potamilus streckersoni]
MSRLSPAKLGDTFLNERDLFEVMRSRKLNQVQIELMRNHRKQIRAIEIAEKSFFSGYETKRVLFLQKMAERVKQRNKIKTDFGTERKPIRKIHRSVLKLYYGTNEETRAENPNSGPSANKDCLKHSLDKTNENISKKNKTEIQLNLDSNVFDSDVQGAEFYNIVKTMTLPKTVKTKMKKELKRTEGDGKEYAFETQFAKHIPRTDILDLKEKPKFMERLNSLPELSMSTKPMVSMEIGSVTPDGRLILTKEDYDEYLNRFRRARDARLHRARRKSETLEQLVASFHVQDDIPDNAFGTERTMHDSGQISINVQGASPHYIYL